MKAILHPIVKEADHAQGGHGPCYAVTLPVGEARVDAVLGDLLAQTRAKAGRLRGALRRALVREDELLAEARSLRDAASRARHGVGLGGNQTPRRLQDYSGRGAAANSPRG